MGIWLIEPSTVTFLSRWPLHDDILKETVGDAGVLV